MERFICLFRQCFQLFPSEQLHWCKQQRMESWAGENAGSFKSTFLDLLLDLKYPPLATVQS